MIFSRLIFRTYVILSQMGWQYYGGKMTITGVNFVRCTRHGLQAARRLWPKTGDRFEVRRQALKLRFWDERHLHPPGKLFDHTFESVKALSGFGIYELGSTTKLAASPTFAWSSSTL